MHLLTSWSASLLSNQSDLVRRRETECPRSDCSEMWREDGESGGPCTQGELSSGEIKAMSEREGECFCAYSAIRSR